MKLIHKSTGKVVREGDKVTDFRGESGIVLGWTKPHSPQSTGRIIVYVQGTEHYCYPEVYFCEWINREDRLEDEQIALGVLKDPIAIGDPTQAIYGFSQPTPVGGFGKFKLVGTETGRMTGERDGSVKYSKTSSQIRDEEVDAGLSSVSSFDRTAQLMAEVEDELNRIQETLQQIKTLLS